MENAQETDNSKGNVPDWLPEWVIPPEWREFFEQYKERIL